MRFKRDAVRVQGVLAAICLAAACAAGCGGDTGFSVSAAQSALGAPGVVPGGTFVANGVPPSPTNTVSLSSVVPPSTIVATTAGVSFTVDVPPGATQVDLQVFAPNGTNLGYFIIPVPAGATSIHVSFNPLGGLQAGTYSFGITIIYTSNGQQVAETTGNSITVTVNQTGAVTGTGTL